MIVMFVATRIMSFLACIATLVSAAAALTSYGHPWRPPGPSDVRSPCPGLNTAANHGFINHSGRNLTLDALLSGLSASMNIGADFTSFAGAGGLLSNPTPGATTFDLDMLDAHNFPIEHDASLSRLDYYFTQDDHTFSPATFSTVLAHFRGRTTTDLKSAARAKYTRVKASRRANPTFVYGPREFVLSYGESALYLQVLGRNTTSGEAEVGWVRTFFEQERFPYDEGWSRPPETITLATLAAMSNALIKANGHDQVPEGLLVTENAVADAFEGVNPVTGELGNSTGYLKER